MIRIVMDHREPEEIREYMKDLGAEVEVKSLSVGDFIVSDKIIIERKTKEDFEGSIIDSRIFSQLERMKEVYPNPVLIIEGVDEVNRINRKALLGAYAAIISSYGASLFFTRNIHGTAEIVYSFAKHEQEAKSSPLRVKARVKTYTLQDEQRAVIEALPGIGPKTAVNILKHFGSINKVFNATEKELIEIDKIGGKKAERIRKVITEKFSKRKKEKIKKLGEF